jgi:hypothetical protein
MPTFGINPANFRLVSAAVGQRTEAHGCWVQRDKEAGCPSAEFKKRLRTRKEARFAVKLGPIIWLSFGTADPGVGVALEVERRIFRLRRL